MAVASLLALRERPGGVREEVGDTLRVATWNLHYGFDEQWRYDPAAIAAALRAADVDIVALQEVDFGRRRSRAGDHIRSARKHR